MEVSDKFLQKVDKWLLQGISLDVTRMSVAQKYRARVCYEAYQIWLQDKQIRTQQLLRNISKRNYTIIYQRAQEGDESSAELCRTLGIKEGSMRSPAELSNDIRCLNHIIDHFQVDTTAIEKAKVVDASDWLITEGMKQNNDRAVTNGAKIKMELHDNFAAKEDVAKQMPKSDLNITGDVSIVKSERVNYTDEEKIRFARKYGLSDAEIQDMIEQEDGTWDVGNGNENENENENYDENENDGSLRDSQDELCSPTNDGSTGSPQVSDFDFDE